MYPEHLDGLELGGIYIHEPGGVLSNVVIAIVATYLAIRLYHRAGNRPKAWILFLLCLALAAAAGIFTHGFPHLLGPKAFYWLWWAKNSIILLGNAALWYAFLPSIISNTSRLYPVVQKLVMLKLVLFSFALALAFSFTPAVIHLALTYFMVIFVTALHRKQVPAYSAFFTAFVLALLSGFLYLIPLHPHPHWLTNSDVVHYLAILSMVFIYRGALLAMGGSLPGIALAPEDDRPKV